LTPITGFTASTQYFFIPHVHGCVLFIGLSLCMEYFAELSFGETGRNTLEACSISDVTINFLKDVY